MYAQITLLCPPFSTLTYRLPAIFPDDFWRIGLRVAVPLGKSRGFRPGYICQFKDSADLTDGIAYKDVAWPLENIPLLDNGLVALAMDLGLRQSVESGLVYGHLLPQGLRKVDIKVKWREKNLSIAEIIRLAPEEMAVLAQEFASGEAAIAQRRKDDGEEEYWRLLVDPPWPVRPAAKKQVETLDFLHERGTTSLKELRSRFGSAVGQILEKLSRMGCIGIDDTMVEAGENLLPPPPAPFEFNAEQKTVLTDLEDALRMETAQCRLVHGVTGSGKTAIYEKIAEICLKLGRSVFLLAPEVALAHKLYRDISLALPGESIFLYHGYQRPTLREKTFRTLAQATNPCIVIGTRSALFLPAVQTGCIILDEEHDSSFKQDEIFPYHAREIAWYRLLRTKGLLILGSATPDIKTFYATREGRLPILSMKKRASGNPLPKVELVNIASAPGKIEAGTLAASAAGMGILSKTCEQALLECMEHGEQAVILLNRRGYAPMMYCVDCQKILRCPHCEIGLAYHKGIQKLVCHYCGYTLPWPAPCPVCHKANFLTIGEGTERLTERLEALAGQKILRLDRDSARRPGRMEEILEGFRNNESPFLVGTQMLSKGHHFPNVTLVIVADGDIGLNLPDYRAAERTFQLLLQSAGRAGRGEKPGKVLIQTRDPFHYCWKYILSSDYEGFYSEELGRRKKRAYPPFTNLALIRISMEQNDLPAGEALDELALLLRKKAQTLDIRLMGPAPAPIAMLRGRRRYQILLKSGSWNCIREIWHFALAQKAAARLRLFLDLDPVNML